MKRTNATIAVLALAAFAVFAAPAVSAGKLPAGVVKFDTDSPSTGEFKRRDIGYQTNAALVYGGYLWLGRQGGIRKFDRITGKWEFFMYDGSICPGFGTIAIVPDPPYIWARLQNTGTLCRFNPKDNSWYSMKHWSIIEHAGSGSQVKFTPDFIYYAGEGGPGWQGLNIIDRKKERWVKLYRSKPISAMLIEPRFMWLGVPAGLLRINRVTEEYTYFQPSEHGGGAFIKEILPIPGALAIATIGDHTGVLGDKLTISKDHINVYIKREKKWYTYKNNEYTKLSKDIDTGKIFITNLFTHPGILILRNGKWSLISSANGLPSDEVLSLDKDDKTLYAATLGGLAALDIKTLKPKDINLHIFRSLRGARRVISDGEFLWVFTSRNLFRVNKKDLFSFPR
ncbi:MAG: hypothetical protein WCX65_15310 [bacterium]